MTLIGCHSRAGYENRYHRDRASIAYIKANKCRRYRKVPWKINHGVFNVVYTVDKVYGRRLYIASTYKTSSFRTLKSSQSKSHVGTAQQAAKYPFLLVV
jgi:hypothetical protein